MGIVFKKDESHTGGVKGQYVATSDSAGTSGGSNYGNNVEWAKNEGWHGSSGTTDWYNAETYYKQIVWNMGTEISQLKEENKQLRAQIEGIQKLLS